jgi:hypothetical protein
MKKQPPLKSSLKVSVLLILTVLSSCTQTNTNQEENSTKTEPEKPICEVTMSASNLRNSLLAPSENLQLTVTKLHELAESHDHNHNRIATQAKNMADESIKLMNASAYVSSHYFDSLLAYSTNSTVLSNSLHAHNQSMGKAKLKKVLAKLESLTGSINTIIERKLKIDKDACLTDKEMLENQIRLY